MAEGGIYVTKRGTRVPFRVRKSTRATSQRVSVDVHGEVEVVVPAYWPSRPPLEFLRLHDDWIEKAYGKKAAARAEYIASCAVPERIEFPVSNEAWELDLHPTNANSVSARADFDRGVLRLSGSVGDDDLVRKALRRFVKLRAQDVLPRLLELVSQDTGIPYASSRVSVAKTRWGSCSSSGEIMLSTRLMFLPQPLAIHVCMHELCHVRHFNHGSDFHAQLKRLDPQADAHGDALKAASILVPGWYDAK